MIDMPATGRETDPEMTTATTVTDVVNVQSTMSVMIERDNVIVTGMIGTGGKEGGEMVMTIGARETGNEGIMLMTITIVIEREIATGIRNLDVDEA